MTYKEYKQLELGDKIIYTSDNRYHTEFTGKVWIVKRTYKTHCPMFQHRDDIAFLAKHKNMKKI